MLHAAVSERCLCDHHLVMKQMFTCLEGCLVARGGCVINATGAFRSSFSSLSRSSASCTRLSNPSGEGCVIRAPRRLSPLCSMLAIRRLGEPEDVLGIEVLGRPQRRVPSSWMCMVLSSSAQASSQHAVHRRTTSTGWLRLLSTSQAGTVSVQCLDVLLLETVNAYQRLGR